MEMQQENIQALAKKLTWQENGKEVGRIFVYFIKNDLHEQPYALIEDLFIEEKFRGQGLGTKLIRKAVEEARKAGCYKIICTSRYSKEKVHRLYLKLGFKDYGKEFRLDL